MSKEPKQPQALRRYRLRHRIAAIYNERPSLKGSPVLVATLAAVEYQADRIFVELEDAALDALAKQRLRDTWVRLTQIATVDRRRLGLEVPPLDDEGAEDFEPGSYADADALERERYRRHYGMEQ